MGPYRFIRSSRVNPGVFPINMTKKERNTKWNFEEYKKWWTPEWHKAIESGMFVHRDLKGGQMSRDMTLFVDDDGKAYHIYSSEVINRYVYHGRMETTSKSLHRERCGENIWRAKHLYLALVRAERPVCIHGGYVASPKPF